MKKLSIFFLLIPICTFSQNCDSTISRLVTYYDEDNLVIERFTNIDYLVNGNIVRNDNHGFITNYAYDSTSKITSVFTLIDSISYSYDSTSRLITTEYFTNVSNSWVYNPDTSLVNYYYSQLHLDSIIKYAWNGTAMVPFNRIQLFYNVNDTLYKINNEVFSGGQWIIDSLTLVYFLPVRSDSIYNDSVPHTEPDRIIRYDYLGRVISIFDTQTELNQSFEYLCNQLWQYHRAYYGSHSGYSNYFVFDSLCRITRNYYGSYSTNGSPHYIVDYYYSGCTSVAVRALDDSSVCRGDSTSILTYHFGGTPPYHISWNPSNGMANDSSLIFRTAPDSTSQYIITITDSNGFSSSDTVLITVFNPLFANIYISSIDTNSICQSAVLTTDSLSPTAFYWYLNNNMYGAYSHVPIVYNGTYVVYVHYNNSPPNGCPAAFDTFQVNFFNHPPPEIDLERTCDHIYVMTGAHDHVEWYLGGVLIPGQTGDTLIATQQGYYTAIVFDSLGCSSYSRGYIYYFPNQPVFTISTQPPSCDSCTDGYTLIDASAGNTFYYFYVDGVWDTSIASIRDTIYNLPEGLHTFCVTHQFTGCSTCQTSLILSNNEMEDVDEYLSVYPNPFNDRLHIKIMNFNSLSGKTLLITNLIGKTIIELPLNQNEIEISKELMPPGFYILNLFTDEGVRSKLVISLD